MKMEIKNNPKMNIKREKIEDILKDISKNVREIFLLFISENLIDLKKIEFKGDLESNIKQKIEDAIKDRYQNMNETFSELRKSGVDLGVLNFKLVMIPLKIKVFLATYEKKDAENVINRIKDIENEINKIKN
jgi:hypothetical protein